MCFSISESRRDSATDIMVLSDTIPESAVHHVIIPESAVLCDIIPESAILHDMMYYCSVKQYCVDSTMLSDVIAYAV